MARLQLSYHISAVTFLSPVALAMSDVLLDSLSDGLQTLYLQLNMFLLDHIHLV